MTQTMLMDGRGVEDRLAAMLEDLARVEEMTKASRRSLSRRLRRQADWAGEPCPAGCLCESCEVRR